MFPHFFLFLGIRHTSALGNALIISNRKSLAPPSDSEKYNQFLAVSLRIPEETVSCTRTNGSSIQLAINHYNKKLKFMFATHAAGDIQPKCRDLLA